MSLETTDHTLTDHAATTDRAPSSEGPARYLAPSWFAHKVFNPLVGFVTRRGLSLKGSRVLTVPGRVSGEPRSVPVNLLFLEGERYLVAPRGVTQWVRNIRVAGGGELRVGRRREQVRVVEVDDADKSPVLRAYLAEWAWEVGAFFEGVDADASDDQLAAIAPGFPVFRVGV